MANNSSEQPPLTTFYLTQKRHEVMQELTVYQPEHCSSPIDFSGVRIAKYLDCCVVHYCFSL